jgi:hypothetical protein
VSHRPKFRIGQGQVKSGPRRAWWRWALEPSPRGARLTEWCGLDCFEVCLNVWPVSWKCAQSGQLWMEQLGRQFGKLLFEQSGEQRSELRGEQRGPRLSPQRSEQPGEQREGLRVEQRGQQLGEQPVERPGKLLREQSGQQLTRQTEGRFGGQPAKPLRGRGSEFVGQHLTSQPTSRWT